RPPARHGARDGGSRAGERGAAAPAHDGAGRAARPPAQRVGTLRRGGLARDLRGAPREALAADRAQPRSLERTMRGFFFRLIITALGLWAAAAIIPGVRIDAWRTLIIGALLLGTETAANHATI